MVRQCPHAFVHLALLVWILSASPVLGLSTGATSSEHQILKRLQVGSFEGGADVVVNGFVQPGWCTNKPATIPAIETRTRLWALLSFDTSSSAGSWQEAAQLHDLYVASSDPSVAVAHVARRGSDDALPLPSVIGSPMHPLVVDVVYECHRAGHALLTLSYRFADAKLTPVTLSFTKECVAHPRHGLSMGISTSNSNNVVNGGTTRWPTATALQRIIPSATNHLEFFWTLQSVEGADDSIAQLVAPPRATVTPFVTGRTSAGGPPPAEVQRWQRRLKQREIQELRFQRQGFWGLPEVALGLGQMQPEPNHHSADIVRVVFSGSLADGGSLPATPVGLPENMPGRPVLNVDLECLHEGAALVEIEIAPFPAYQPYRPINIALVKQCGGNVHQGFDVATKEMTLMSDTVIPDLIKNGKVVGNFGTVGNLDDMAVVHWRLRSGGLGVPDASHLTCGPHHHRHPGRGVVNAYLVPPTKEGTGDDGSITGRQEMHFNCSNAGIATCTLHFAWQLYDGPALHFRKVCGGVRGDLDIRSDVPGTPVVLLQGKQQSAWSLDPKVTLPADEERASFSISLDRALTPGEEPLVIDSPQVRVLRPDIVKASVVGDLAEGGQVDSAMGVATLEVEMECLETGTSRIEVSLPVHAAQYQPIDFAFEKRCVVLSFWQQGYVMAIATFALLFCVTATIMMVCVNHFQKELSKDLQQLREMGDDPFLTSQQAHHADSEMAAY